MYCCVYSTKTPDDGQKTCLKHAEFYSKNKFEKLVHLVGFIIRIYHDARSSECQTGSQLISWFEFSYEAQYTFSENVGSQNNVHWCYKNPHAAEVPFAWP